MSIDFSEDLQVPMKFEPESLHWSHSQITIHSCLVKFDGQKTYHSYLSQIKKIDHVLVKVAIEALLAEIDIKQGTAVIIKNNCTSHKDLATIFSDMQERTDEMKLAIIRVFGIHEHGEG